MNDSSNIIRNLGEEVMWKGVCSPFWGLKDVTIFLKNTGSGYFTISCTVVYYLTQ